MSGFGAGAGEDHAPHNAAGRSGSWRQEQRHHRAPTSWVYFILQGSLSFALYFYNGLFDTRRYCRTVAFVRRAHSRLRCFAGAYWFHGSSDVLYRRVACGDYRICRFGESCRSSTGCATAHILHQAITVPLPVAAGPFMTPGLLFCAGAYVSASASVTTPLHSEWPPPVSVRAVRQCLQGLGVLAPPSNIYAGATGTL